MKDNKLYIQVAETLSNTPVTVLAPQGFKFTEVVLNNSSADPAYLADSSYPTISDWTAKQLIKDSIVLEPKEVAPMPAAMAVKTLTVLGIDEGYQQAVLAIEEDVAWVEVGDVACLITENYPLGVLGVVHAVDTTLKTVTIDGFTSEDLGISGTLEISFTVQEGAFIEIDDASAAPMVCSGGGLFENKLYMPVPNDLPAVEGSYDIYLPKPLVFPGATSPGITTSIPLGKLAGVRLAAPNGTTVNGYLVAEREE